MKANNNTGKQMSKDFAVAVVIAREQMSVHGKLELNFEAITPARASRIYRNAFPNAGYGSRLYGVFESGANNGAGRARVFMGDIQGWTIEAQVWTLFHELAHAEHY